MVETGIMTPKLQEDQKYWRSQALGLTEATYIPMDHSRPMVYSKIVASVGLDLQADIVSKLKLLTRGSSRLELTTLMAALKVCLFRYSARQKVVVGTAAYRESERSESQTNALLIVSDIKTDIPFREFLLEVRGTLSSAFSRQGYPINKLIQDLGLESVTNYCPLFDVALIHKDIQGDLPDVKNDLTITFYRNDRGLNGNIEYNARLYDKETIERFANHYLSALSEALANIDSALGALNIVTEQERRQLLVDNNRTTTDFPSQSTIHELIKLQAERTSQSIAVVCQDESLSYAELDARADQLADYLMKLGIGPEIRVGLLLERSIEMIVALLGVLKAGGAYVPLDPTYPVERLRYMVADSAPAALLIQGHLRDLAADLGSPALVVDLTEQAPVWRAQPRSNPGRIGAGLGTESLAYVLYTSGSTGTPKGVAIEHRNTVNFICWARRAFAREALERTLFSTSLNFDLAVFELFAPLCVGGKVRIVENALDLAREAVDVTLINTVPTAMRALVEGRNVPATAQVVNLAGEPLKKALVEEIFETTGVEEVCNLYGPTETTTYSTWVAVSRGERFAGHIGRPIANTRVYILDGYGKPVPVGVMGEIYIGGEGVARGYLNRPDLTAVRFVADPFNDSPGGRLYRTGDLAKYLPGGDIEFCGRNDHQVKIRGHRVELGEIESALTHHTSVREAAVIAREINGDRRLVAYTVPSQRGAATAGELRTFLQSRLPDYMLPFAFVSISAFPLTPSGKVDRRALPEPEPERSESKKIYAPPRSWMEQQLCKLWSEVLGVEKIGIFDNFFELGGDSILTIQVVARAHRLGMYFQPREIFQHQTIAALSAVAEQTYSIQSEQGVIVGPVPLTPIQHWLFEQDLPEVRHYNMGYLFELRKDFSFPEWQRIFRELFAHHDALRLRFTQEGTAWKQFMDDFDETAAPFTLIDLSDLSAPMKEPAITRAATLLQSSLNLRSGPVVRTACFNRGDSESSYLLLIAHHLVIDGVSWRILLEDLHAIGRQLIEDNPVNLPPKTTSFKQWSEKLMKYARSGHAREKLSNWIANAVISNTQLPIDFEKGPRLESSASILSVSLTADETEFLLREVSAHSQARMDEILLTALASSLACWTGSKSLLIDVEGHGREEIDEAVDLSRTIGWFTTISPAILEMNETWEPDEALASVKHQLRRDLQLGAHFGLGRYLSDERSLTQQLQSLVRAEVCFNYLGQIDQTFAENSLLSFVNIPIGPIMGPNNPLTHLLYIGAIIYRGQLHIRFKYSQSCHSRATIESVAQNTLKGLRKLITYYRERLDQEPAFFLPGIERSELASVLTRIKIEGDQIPVDQSLVEDLYPLSPAQQGILFHSLNAPAPGIYVNQISGSIKELNVASFERSWERVIERHPILRTAFIWESKSGPMQVVLRRAPLSLVKIDWSSLSARDSKERWEAYVNDDRIQGFNLSGLPLMRLTLCQIGKDSYRFLWTHHHILLDGWSIFLILKELFELYTADCEESKAVLGDIPSYRNYITWLGKQDLKKAEEFWRIMLQGFISPTPISNQTDIIEGEEGYEEQKINVPPEFLNDLRALARQHRLTINTLMQGAWGIMVSYLSGHNDIVFGVTVSGRPAELTDVETMVGLFINILPLRLKIRSEDILLDWLKAAQETHVEVRQYEYSPLAQVQRWANGMRAQPLFESILTFQNYPVDASIAEHSKALRINDVSHHNRTNYPLTIIISSGAELSLKAIYNKRRFTADTISRILGQFSALLQHFCVEPDTRLGNLRETLDRSLKSQMLAQREKYEATARSRFKSLKPKCVTLPESDLVETCTPDKSLTMPIVFKPVVSGLDLIDWVKGNRRQVEAELLKFGAALFRGFDMKSIKRFEQFASIVCGELFNEYGDLPREEAGGNVYSSTPYPSNKAILLHNESSHQHCWPLKIAFMSLVVAQHGGETPLADCREIYRTINPKLRDRLMRKKVMYIRNYIEGVDVSWRKFFRTTRKSDVEEYCRSSSINYQWKSGDRLKTSKIRPAITKHPKTNEMVFFNQLQLHHISCLDAQAREALLATFTEEDLPRNVYYGDGSPIEDSVIQEISELTRQSTISFPWQEGDVLILDNMLVAHGRNPYIGPRKIVVAMGTMIQDGGC